MTFNLTLLTRIGGLLIRHALTYGGGFLVGNGMINSTQESDLIGAAMTIIGIAWSAYQKYQANKAAKSNDLTGATIKQGFVESAPLPPIK